MVAVTGNAKVGSVTFAPTVSITLPAVVATGFPSASTTGVPAGTVLSAYTGGSKITAAGTTITGKTITTPIELGPVAHNTTFRNCLFKMQAFWHVLNEQGATNLQIIDCEFDGMKDSGNDCAVSGGNYTLTRVNIHDTVDGLKVGSNVVVQDSYIHDLYITANSHNDGMQSLGTTSLTVRHNTIIVKDGATSCVILSTGSASDMRNVLIDNNLLAGGAFTVYGGYQSGSDVQSRVSNIAITNNRISTQIFARGGAYGPFTSVDSPVVMSGNVWHDGTKAGQPAT